MKLKNYFSKLYLIVGTGNTSFQSRISVTIIIFLFGFLTNVILAATITSTSSGGNWTNTSTWSGGIIPVATDDVVIATTGTNKVTLNANKTLASLVVNTGSTLDLTTRALTVGGSVNNAGTITATSGKINQSAAGDFTNSGIITFSGLGKLTLWGSLINTGTISLASSPIIMTGTNAASNTVDGFTTTGNVSFTRTAGSVTFTGSVTGAAFTVDGAGGNINLGDGNTHTFSGYITLTNGTLEGGTSVLKGTRSGGFFRNNGGTFNAQNGTIEAGYSGNQSLTGTQTSVFSNLIFSGSGTKTLPAYELTVNGNIVIEGTTLVAPSYTLNVGGNLTVGSSASFRGRAINHNIAGDFNQQGTFTINTGTITLNGTSAQQIKGSSNITFYNLTIANPTGVTLDSELTVNVNNNLQINSGAVLDIGSDRLVNAERIVNNAGTTGIIIRADEVAPNGSLIFNNIESEPVEGTVEMYTKAYYDASGPTGYKYKWQYFGIPLRSLATANPTFAGSYVRKHYEPGTGSGYWTTVSNSSSLTAVDGYQITQVNPKIVEFSGILENRPISRDLSYTSGAAIPGQHVLSNPFTAAIDISEISFGADLEETIYFFNTGSKADWENQTGTDWSAGQYITVPKNLAGSGGLPGSIPSMQGFVVSTKSPHSSTNISIPYSTASVKNDSKLRAKAVEQKVFTQITVAGSKYEDKMWLFSQPECTHGFDNGWDGRKFFGSALKPQIYALETDGNYQVNAVNNVDSTILGFRTGQDTEYTIYFDHTNIDLQYQELYLTDLATNETVDILQNGSSYTFNTTDSQDGARFKISVSEPTA